MDPDQARQRDFLLDSNRWYIVYLKFVFEKGKIKKKRLKEKKTLINNVNAACACICKILLSYGINIFSH